MPQFIYGYVVTTLEGINLQASLDEDAGNEALASFEQAYSRVQQQVVAAGVRPEDQLWSQAVALRKGTGSGQQDQYVLVLGVVHEEGEPREPLPDALRRVFEGRATIEDLPVQFVDFE